MKSISLLLLAASRSFTSPASHPLSSPDQTLTPRQAPAQNANLLGHPIYSSGPYTFVSCDAQQGSALVDLFTQIGDVTNNQLMPASLTPTADPTQDPFPVFFKDNARHDINSAFNGMLGAPLYNSAGQAYNKRPKLICLNADGPELARALGVCSQGINPVSFTEDSQGSTVIYLCPAFFDNLPPFPTKGVNCPSVNATADPSNFYAHNDAVQNRFSVIVHELIHAYLSEALNPSYPNTETYPLNQIITLDKTRQYWNANNYAYYAACVYAGCQSYPVGIAPSATGTSTGQSAATDGVPKIIDDYGYYVGVDTAGLEKNLTALGYLPG